MNKFVVLLSSFFVNMGIGLIMPVTMLYVNKGLDKSILIASYTLLSFSLAMMIGNLIGGRLFDKWHSKKIAVIGALITTSAVFLIAIFPMWPSYLLLISLYGIGLGLLNSAIAGYIAHQHKTDGNIFTVAYWLANVGIGLATFLSGILFSINIRVVFLLAGILFFITLILIMVFLSKVNSSHEVPTAVQKTSFGRKKLRMILIVAFTIVVVWIGYEQWVSNLSIFMLDKGRTVKEYSVLFTISTIEIVILQPVLGKFFKNNFSNEKKRVLGGLAFFGMSFVVVMFAKEYWQFLIAITLMSIGDIFALTTFPSVLNRLANDGNRAQIQTISSAMGSLGRAIGPLLGSYIITLSSFSGMFVSMTILTIVAMLIFLTLKEHDVVI